MRIRLDIEVKLYEKAKKISRIHLAYSGEDGLDNPKLRWLVTHEYWNLLREEWPKRLILVTPTMISYMGQIKEIYEAYFETKI